MRSRPSSHGLGEGGFTVLEFLVASCIGLLMMGLALSSALGSRHVYRDDIVRTRINQNLRSAIDILTLNARQAGESLEPQFPAIMIINGASGAPDELVLRRNLYGNEVLNVCQSLTAGTSTASILTSNGPANLNANCRYSSGWRGFVDTWEAYRLQQPGGVANAFAFNRTTHQGEFFRYTGRTDTGTQLSILRDPGNWSFSYSGDGVSAALYLVQEYRYRVLNGVLQLVINDNLASPLNVIDGISDFQALAHMSDGSTQATFGINDNWTSLESIEVRLTGEQKSGARELSSTITSRIFPRNVLSH